MARITVIGQSGTGKSYGAGSVIERVLDPSHPDNPGETFDIAIHFDPEDEEVGLSDQDNDPLYQRLDVTAEMAASLDWRKVIYNHRKLRIVPDMREEQMRTVYGDICAAVFTLVKDLAPDLTAFVSCDEAGNIVPQHGADDRVLTLQSRGRKHGAETCYICQRPQQIHTGLLSQADRRIYFRVDNDNDLGKLDKQAGFSVQSVEVPNGRGLESLRNRECIIENRSSGDYVVESTNEWVRMRPHYSGDDGIVDDALPV